MTEIIVAEEVSKAPAQRALSLLDMEPEAMRAKATKIANVLSDIIEKQKLYVNIQGKKHVRVDAWCALGNFLGVVPREVGVRELEDGSYEAEVELLRWADGTRIGGASALCSITEKRWGSADKYARRSMAVTRATGKAFRLAFSWIVCLAGYEPTPSEEMPHDDHTPREQKKAGTYTGTAEQQQKIIKILEDKKIPQEHWQSIDEKMMNRPSTDLYTVIAEVMQ